MKVVSACLNHIKHPFTGSKVKLNKCEKLAALSGLLLTPLLVLPGLLAFYGLSAALKWRKVLQLKSQTSFSALISSTIIPAPIPIKIKTGNNLIKKAPPPSVKPSLKTPAPSVKPPLTDEDIFYDLNTKASVKKIFMKLESSQNISKIGYHLLSLKKEIKHSALTWKKYVEFLHNLDPEPFFRIFDAILKMNDSTLADSYIKINKNNLKEFLDAKDTYNLGFLEKACSDWMKTHEKEFTKEELVDLAVEYNLEEIETQFYEELLLSDQEWLDDEKKLIAKLAPHMTTYKLPDKLPRANMKFLLPYCIADVYPPKAVESFLFEELLKLQLSGQASVLAEQLLITWAPAIKVLEVSSKDWSKFKNILPHFTQMEKLTVSRPFSSNSVVTDEDIALLPRNLKQFSLYENITDNGLSFLPPALTSLTLVGDLVTGKGWAHLPKTLKSFTQLYCNKILEKDLSLLPQIKTLHLSSFSALTDKGVDLIPKSISSLKLNTVLINGIGLASLPQSLESLDLSQCPNLKNLINLPQHLTKLNVHLCNITDESIKNLPASIKDLQLTYCEYVTGKDVPYPQSLIELSLGGCQNLVDPNLMNLPNGLKTLRLYGTKIDPQTKLTHLPKCKVTF